MHFLYIAVCFGCLFKIMRLYYPPKKPGYHSIIKTKDFIANAMSLILIGTTYIVEPLLKLCGVLHHTLLDWSWWSYAGRNGKNLNQDNQNLIAIKETWCLINIPTLSKYWQKGSSKRLKGRLWSVVLCYPHVLTYFWIPLFGFYAEVRIICTIWQDKDDAWTVTSRICQNCSKQFKKMHKKYTQNSGGSFPLCNYFILSAKSLNCPEDVSSSINIAGTAGNSWDFL